MEKEAQKISGEVNSVIKARLENRYVKGALDLLAQMSGAFDPRADNRVYIAGGIAVIFWLDGSRVTHDLDAVFDGDVLPDMAIPSRNGIINVDFAFNDTLSLVQEDYRDRAFQVAEFGPLKVLMIAPVDLVLMKISRGLQKDLDDARNLIKAGLVDKNDLIVLAEDAFKIYIGNPAFPRANLETLLEDEAWTPNNQQKRKKSRQTGKTGKKAISSSRP